MNVSLRDMSSIVLLAIMVTASIVGCAQIRKLTYPKDFTYLEKKEVETLMQKMGDGIARLDKLVKEALPSDTIQQQNIVAELRSLERIAIRLSGGHTQTNQFVIGDHIEQLISDVGTARMFANNNLPNYNKAGEITNSCKACHQFR